MSALSVSPSGGLRGTLRVPGDKSISHRALILAALAEGTSTLRGLSTGADVAHTRAAVAALGATVNGAPPETVRVQGGQLREAEHVIDVGNSGTGIRLLSGLCAGQPFLTVLEGDASVARRPMDRVADPLRLMGAQVDGRDGGRFPPLVVRGGGLRGIEYHLPVASAQVKGAVLLAGLAAVGATVVHEPAPTRRHTEELLALAGVNVTIDDGTVALESSAVQPLDLEVPGDPSQAAFWVVAAAVVPDSAVTIENVYVGPARAGFLDVLGRMGADIRVVPTSVKGHADLHVRSSELSGTIVEPAEIPGLIDEIPVLAVAAARAEGETRFLGAGELRAKESDRLATTTSELGHLGARLDVEGDTLRILGPTEIVGGEVTAHGDHRIAMASAIAGLAATAPITIEGWEAVVTSYPGFETDLRTLTGSGGD